MIAIDTNLLVYAHRTEFPWHEGAVRTLSHLAGSGGPWSIPWPCVHEFINVVTKSPFRPLTTLAEAFKAIEAWVTRPSFHFLGEGNDHLAILKRIASGAHVTGARIHDARIAAICLANGVSELWSADRDFSRFPELKVINPLVR